jgi:hypothetical protein
MSAARVKSKTLATWLAVVGGGFGLHRFYLHGLRDGWGWLHVPMTLLGMAGVQRMSAFGVDDQVAPWLLPLGGLSITAGMLAAILCGLCSDERWDARHNPEAASGRGTPPGGWLAVLGVIAALLIGAAMLLSSITFTLQRYFEAQVAAAQAETARRP